jgi:hypothetical protein
MGWGDSDSKPIVSQDDDYTAKGRGATPEKETFRLVGAACNFCGREMDDHKPGCRKLQ